MRLGRVGFLAAVALCVTGLVVFVVAERVGGRRQSDHGNDRWFGRRQRAGHERQPGQLHARRTDLLHRDGLRARPVELVLAQQRLQHRPRRRRRRDHLERPDRARLHRPARARSASRSASPRYAPATPSTPSTRWSTPPTSATSPRATPERAARSFVDPAVPATAPRPIPRCTWKGGCGREPLTATASPGPQRTAQPERPDLRRRHPHLQRRTRGAPGATSSTAARATPTPSPSSATSQASASTSTTSTAAAPSATRASRSRTELSDITVDGNGDNSIQTNAFDPTHGDELLLLRPHLAVGRRPRSTTRRAPTVTTVEAGTTVHDSVTVTGSGGKTPTGNVTFDWFTNNTCTGTPAANSGAVALSGSGNTATADATGFAQTPARRGRSTASSPTTPVTSTTRPRTARASRSRSSTRRSRSRRTRRRTPSGSPHIFTATVQVNSGHRLRRPRRTAPSSPSRSSPARAALTPGQRPVHDDERHLHGHRGLEPAGQHRPQRHDLAGRRRDHADPHDRRQPRG